MKLEEIADSIATVGLWGAASGATGVVGSLGALVVGSKMGQGIAEQIFYIGCASSVLTVSSLLLMATPEMLSYVKSGISRKY